MKNVKFLGVLLACSMLIAGCNAKKGSDTPVTPDTPTDPADPVDPPTPPTPEVKDWTAAEKALIAQYAYGITIPYHNMQGNGAMFYDEEYECLTVTGAQLTAEQLKAYSEKFTADDGWVVEEDTVFPGTYFATTYAVVNDTIRYVRIDLYCVDKNDDIASSGTFYMDIDDPYVYSWADLGVDQVLTALGSTTTLQELKADFYQLIDITDYGIATIYAYNVTQGDYDAYLSYLQTDWTMKIDEETSEVSYISPKEDLELDFEYEEGVATIGLYTYEPEGGDDPDPVDPAEGVQYAKVETALEDWSGDYLIVYEKSDTEAYVLDASKATDTSTMKAAGNYVTAAIDDETITITEDDENLANAVFEISALETGYSVKSSKTEKYIGNSGTGKTIQVSDTAYANALTLAADGVDIKAVDGSTHLRFNTTGDMFRYYTDANYTGQSPIQLYKLVEE